MMQYPWGKGTPKWVRDATANDSDKSFTVPAGKAWALQYVYAEITATATVGNRSLAVHIRDTNPSVIVVEATANIAAAQKGNIRLINGAPRSTTAQRMLDGTTATVSQENQLPMLALLPAGYSVRVWDSAAIDAAADDMTVVLHYVEYDA